jgi:phosphoglycerol transferase MdoB-like AlkP superfamily enzyme
MGVGGDFDKLLPQFLKDFWFIPIFWILSIWLFVFLNNKINFSGSYNKSLKSNLLHIFVFIIIIFSTVIGIRGGFQLRPLDIINAGKYSNSKNIPLVLNTPFTIIKTIGLPVLQKKEYYSNDVELNKIYSPFHLRNSISKDTSNYNVVIVIFESLSQEHIGALNNTKDYSGFTPFLDSLIKKSYVTSGFANGKRSIEGIPAILASIPTLMNEAYITSMYAGNKINSLASLLRSEGYNTSFFHGGSNGTMGFESFAKVAGFNSYYGRNQYNNETDYDGKWGIFDEPYFQYFANKLNETKQPFFSTIFTLSSHHPYTVPEKYKGKFKKGKLEIQESIMYADFSLRKFFETASKMPWFNKTIFVITADHTSEAYFDYYQNNIGMYSIPIIYYIPNNDSIRFTEKKLSQQTDIMPTVLGLVNFKGNYFSFGNDIFDSTQPNFSISYLNNEYQILKDGFVLRFDGKNSTALYNFKKDSLLKNNLINININQKVKLETFTKAVIQQYNNNMINNRMTNEK